jgi:hypothetical protein
MKCTKCAFEGDLKYFRARGRSRVDGTVATQPTCWFCRHIEGNKENYQKVKLADKNAKLVVLAHYGASCKCCGESCVDFLNVDTSSYPKSQYMWKRIVQDKFPEEVQIACFKCNWAKGSFGICPHQQK